MEPREHDDRSTDHHAETPVCVPRCPWCGAPAPVVHVHGHGQCARCGTNREPCCQPD